MEPKERRVYWPGLLIPIAIAGAWIFYPIVAEAIKPVEVPSHRQRAGVPDISTIKTQLSVFEINNGRYPTTTEGLGILVTNPGYMPAWPHPYLDKMPLDPWGHPYIYHCPGRNGKDFDLYSMGPDGIDGTADDIGDTNRF